jgi:hypothetical protein
MRWVLSVVRTVLLGMLTLLALAAAAAWAYGTWTANSRVIEAEWGGIKGERFSFYAVADHGEVLSLSCQHSEGPATDLGWYWDSWESPGLERLVAVLPYWYIEAWNMGPGPEEWRRGVFHHGGRGFTLIVETWFAVALFGIWPFLALVRYGIRIYRRRWRRLHGRCVRCGHNLTGLPGPRCPECGTLLVPAIAREGSMLV